MLIGANAVVYGWNGGSGVLLDRLEIAEQMKKSSGRFQREPRRALRTDRTMRAQDRLRLLGQSVQVPCDNSIS